jgi:hypothetical protein
MAITDFEPPTRGERKERTMRKLIATAILACMGLGMSGCFFFDAAHNRQHMEVIRHDLNLIHEDLDWLLMLQEKSPNRAYYR